MAKIATDSFIVSELLCYFKKKYGVFDNRKLNSIIHDFYDPGYISTTKDILVAEVEKLKSDRQLASTYS